MLLVGVVALVRVDVDAVGLQEGVVVLVSVDVDALGEGDPFVLLVVLKGVDIKIIYEICFNFITCVE